MTDVLVVFGTRPEGIKLAPLIAKFYQNEALKIETLVTGQHKEMVKTVIKLFKIKVNYDLSIMQPGQDLFDVTSKILLGMREALKKIKPKIVLIHGDTTTSMATALACFYLNIPVGHVEAGLRTNNIGSPFPEEFNRKVNGLLAKIHFAPTSEAYTNLRNEGIPSENIKVTGNTVIDALRLIVSRLEQDEKFSEIVSYRLIEELKFDYTQQKFILITGHRRENFGIGFENICNAIRRLAMKFPDVNFVYPVHLNPNVKNLVTNMLGATANIHLIEPQSYENFTSLLMHCYFVLTDSGGIQEEAPSLGKPVLLMRDTTERPEAVEAGTVALVGPNQEEIFLHSCELIDNREKYNAMAGATNPYGDGRASEYIVEAIVNFLKEKELA